MNRIIYIFGLALLLFSCQGSIKQSGSVYEILSFPVENGIAETDYPVGLLMMSNKDAVLIARSKNTYPEILTSLYKSVDEGRNWAKVFTTKDWKAEHLEERDGIIYIANNAASTEKEQRSEILYSKDTGRTWQTLKHFGSKLLVIKPMEQSGMVAYQSSEDTSEYSKISYKCLVSSQKSPEWEDAHIDMCAGPNLTSLSKDKLIYTAGFPYRIFQVSFGDLTKDTLRIRPLICPSQIIASEEDIFGIWNGKRADYFRIAGDSAVFVSRIRFKGALTDHIPDRIYQHGDIVYTSVLVPGREPDVRMFISTDRARSWTQVDTKGPIDKEYDRVWTPVGEAWFMAGHNDFMVSYCLGEKDGRRRDFIKIIRPKAVPSKVGI